MSFIALLKRKKNDSLFMLLCHNLAQCQPSITEDSEQHRAQFTHKREAVSSHRIRTILPRWVAEFHELACRIWQNFPRKTVGPNDNVHINFLAE